MCVCVCVCVCMCTRVQCISLDQLQYCGVVCQLAEKRLIRASSAPVWLYSPVGAPQLATVYYVVDLLTKSFHCSCMGSLT